MSRHTSRRRILFHFGRNTELTYLLDLSRDSDPSTTQPVQPSHDNCMPNQDPNPFCFTEMPEIDPFEMFDPTFDLDGIDACLEGSLDLSIPMELLY